MTNSNEVINGYYFQTDPTTGEYLWSNQAPEGYTEGDPSVLTRTVQTGMQDDPSTAQTYYTINGYGKSRSGQPYINYKSYRKDGYHIPLQERIARRRAENEILGKRGEVTEYEQLIGGNDLTRRDLRSSNSTRKQFIGHQYTDESQAQTVQQALLPSMKKHENGYFDAVKFHTWKDPVIKVPRRCPTCDGKIEWVEVGGAHHSIPIKWDYIKGRDLSRKSSISSHTTYDQMPVYETQYVQGSLPRTELETKTIEASSESTTPKVSKTSTRTTGGSSGRTGRPRTSTSTQRKYTPPTSSTQNTSITQTWQNTYHPFTGELISRVQINQNGGTLNYFDYIR